MAFKTLMKKSTRMLPSRTIKITKQGRVFFSHDLRKKIEKFKALEILIDVDYNKLAFKPSSDVDRAFTLTDYKNKHSSRGIQSSKLSSIGLFGKFDARWTEGKIIIENIKIKGVEEIRFWEDEEDL